MLNLIGKQIGLGLAVVITAVTLTFFMVRMSGDPTAQILPQDATAEQRLAMQKQLGLDQPLPRQYMNYMQGAAKGEFGNSYFDGDTVTAIIMRRLPNTALLASSALAIALVFAIPPGYATAVWLPSGLAAAAVVSWGARCWPGIWAGAALANFSVNLSIPAAIGIATGNTLEALCAGYLACAVPLALAVLDPVSAALVLATFGALPAAALAAHAFDARTGRFLLPTVYAIPLASFLLIALWLVCVLAFFL